MLLIDKPIGWTSHDVVAVVRRTLGIRRVGHAGTLDPFASGLLLVLLGPATRLARFVEREAKRYRAEVQLGVSTDTDDGTGTVIATAPAGPWPEPGVVAAAVTEMVGTHWQEPPVYSAKHVAGTRSYRLARSGRAVPLAPVAVTIHALDLLDYAPPRVTLDALVSRGTYLRSVARDLGRRLDLPAHCAELRRTAIGRFGVDEAVDPRAATLADIRPPAEVLRHLPSWTLDPEGLQRVSHGGSVAAAESLGDEVALVDEEGALVAVAEARDGRWQPVVVLGAGVEV